MRIKDRDLEKIFLWEYTIGHSTNCYDARVSEMEYYTFLDISYLLFHPTRAVNLIKKNEYVN